ncbi:hypothetical protein PTI98_002418 [Pleurotus ostreatus]|nr:hypothetical protein PTI98_002418 [Pleurotus ostreatus]
MTPDVDVEQGEHYKGYEATEIDHERAALLPNDVEKPEELAVVPKKSCSRPRFTSLHLSLAFVGGILACFLGQYAFCGTDCFSPRYSDGGSAGQVHANVVPTYVGSTERHHFPPPSPTNAYPTLFPSDVGYPGGTPTGAEAALIITAPAYPLHTGAAHLVVPQSMVKGTSDPETTTKKFSLLKSWGNLSPWYSVGRNAFGLDSGPEPPETCRITGMHLLHRHGARYPTAWTSYGGPANLATKLNSDTKSWNASGPLSFLSDWTYKLGEEVLTPFGRQQLYDLGISMRLKYGYLLKNFTETNTIPIFRTESQDRMLNSAINFALGFFGHPLEGKYQQSITIEADGFNNTLAPYDTCPNARDKLKSDRGLWYVKKWAPIYLRDARSRIQAHLKGFDLTYEDVFTMQQMCAYETVAIGYSKFCELFTAEEWDGFDYSLDLTFWYNSAFGSPVARVQGIGYIQELIARLTHTPIATHNSSTNSTLNDNPITFPLGQSLYVDATHEVVVLNVITALNLTTLAADGPLPYDRIPLNRKFKVSELAPFATNMQFQLLECTSTPGPQIRIIVNDGVVPLTGIKGCPEQRDGMCPVEAFITAQKEIIRQTDWNYDCHGDWTVPVGTDWNTTTGDPPK